MTRAGLSRQRVLEAAVEFVDRDGLDALSMRKLGDLLGVEAMSLYRHVANKADLLDGIHETILKEMPAPTLGGSWREDLRMLARSLRQVLNRHPNTLPLFATRPALSPGSLLLVEIVLGMFREAGFNAEQSLSAWQTVFVYVVGHNLLSFRPAEPRSKKLGTQRTSLEDLPHLASMADALARHDQEQAFEFGLDVLLRGLDAQLSQGVADLIEEIR